MFDELLITQIKKGSAGLRIKEKADLMKTSTLREDVGKEK